MRNKTLAKSSTSIFGISFFLIASLTPPPGLRTGTKILDKIGKISLKRGSGGLFPRGAGHSQFTKENVGLEKYISPKSKKQAIPLPKDSNKKLAEKLFCLQLGRIPVLFLFLSVH
jgi:hypothetical protein